MKSFHSSFRPVGILFFKNLRYLFLLVLLPIAIILGITVFTVDQYIDNEIDKYATRSLNNYHVFSDSLFSKAYILANQLAGDADVQLFFLHMPDTEVYYNRITISKLIGSTTAADLIIDSVYLHSLNSDHIYSNSGIQSRASFWDSDALIDYSSYMPNARSCFLYRESPNKTPFVSFYQLVGSRNSPMGVVIINYDLRKIGNQLASLRGEYDSALYMLDSQGQPLRTLFSDKGIPAPSSDAAQQVILTGSSAVADHFIYQAAPVSYTDWSFLLAIPTSVNYEKLQGILQPIILVLLIVIFIILLLTFLISLRLYSPIRSIMEMLMNAVPEYDDLAAKHPEEYTFISTVISNTISEKNLMGKELETQIQTLKKAQSIALQSQINPHFFYNTLDSISWTAMALTKGSNEVSQMLTKLASMLRYSLEDVNTLVPFEKELTHAKDYLELQALCWGDRFSVQWAISPNTAQYPIIKIVLQPILENALFHGIKPLPAQKKGLISISTAFSGDAFCISISDNGVGMSSEAVNELNQSFLSDDIRQKAHIGLMNVNQRIKLIMGNAYGLSVSSTLGRGTVVTCRLPAAPNIFPESKASGLSTPPQKKSLQDLKIHR